MTAPLLALRLTWPVPQVAMENVEVADESMFNANEFMNFQSFASLG